MAAAPQPAVGILPEKADLHTAEARVNKHKADWRGWKFMWPFAVVFVFVFIIPIVYAIYISFFKKQMVGGTKFVGFENYARLIQDPQFWSSVGASLSSPYSRCRSCCFWPQPWPSLWIR